ncbi:nucleotide exchange factor GrpE [bacterium]|nr:nucleotide exchange factor GrpE [candidate division CSSED10-310 bacterium]
MEYRKPLPLDENYGDYDAGGEQEEKESDFIDISSDDLADVDGDIASALAAISKVKFKKQSEDADEVTLETDLEEAEVVIETEEEADSELSETEAQTTESATEEKTVSESALKTSKDAIIRLQRIVRSLQSKVKNLRKKSEEDAQIISELNKKAEEYQGSWVRVNADYQNFQKRTRTKMKEFIQHERMNIIRDLLPIVENFKRALLQQESSGFMEGMQLIYRQTEELLSGWGVKEIPSKGEIFDPFIHDAIDRIVVENSEDNNRIIDVFETGYYIGQKVLRPSKVIVGFYPATVKTSDTSSKDVDEQHEMSVEGDEKEDQSQDTEGVQDGDKVDVMEHKTDSDEEEETDINGLETEKSK